MNILANYHGDNPRVPVFETVPEMKIFTDEEYLEDGKIVGSPMFGEFLPKAGLSDMLGAGSGKRSSLGYVITAVHFPKGSRVLQKMRSVSGNECRLMPHMRRLSQIRLRLMEQEFQAKRLEATIDLLSTGVILLNRRGSGCGDESSC